jgi:hypothetical protein
MSDTHELRMPLQFIQPVPERGTCQVKPRNDATNDRIFFRETKEPVCFKVIGYSLHCDAAIEVVPLEHRAQIAGHPGPSEHARLRRHPRIRERTRVKEVNVSVKAHATISLPMLRLLLVAIIAVLASCERRPSPTVFVDPALAVLVPPDTIALAGVRMQQLAKTPFYREWVETRQLQFVEDFRRRTGLDPTKDLWEFLLASDGTATLVLVRGKFSQQGREPRLDIEGARRSDYKGYTMIGTDEAAVVFLNPTTAAAGATAAVKRLIDRRNEVSGLPAALESRLKLILSSNQAWFVANVSGRIPQLSDRDPGIWSALARLAGTVEFARGGLDVREEFRANISVESATEKDAEELRGALRALLGLGRLNTTEERRDMLTVFDGMQVSREGSVVHFSTDIPFDVLKKSAAPYLTPRGK